MLLVIVLAILAGAGIIFGWLMRRRSRTAAENLSDLALHQRLDNLTQIVLQQLKENREAVEGQLRESRETTHRSAVAFSQQAQGLISGLTQMQELVKNVHQSVQGVVSFQNIFKSPKLRGQWGETSLEAILGQYFPRELYGIQHYFRSGEAVDAVLKLPNSQILPIDSKFNWENFEKMVNADNEIGRDSFRKLFIGDVKKKIDEIAAKYILPSEGTTDLALMYVPAEGVYYEIVHQVKEVDIADYARRKKIILISPNTFYLTLSAIQYWFRDVQITKQTQEIIKRLSRINQDADKLGEDFRRLGKHLSDAQGSFEESEKRLELMVDRVHKVTGQEAPEEAVLKE